MVKKNYPIAFEVAGPAAMFARPDTGSSPVSYAAPTKSALKSMSETVAFANNAYFTPKRVEICAPVVYHKYTTNYAGPLRKSGTSNFQIFATVLENVCYKIYGEIETRETLHVGQNPGHMLQEVFLRRLRLGQFYSTPFLGWKEFIPTYFGPLRNHTHADTSIERILPTMLVEMYTSPTRGRIAPQFKENVMIRQGVLCYD